jgi:methylated-DNA-[protein]-cysteine S-methyltransferase
MNLVTARLDTPVGPLALYVREGALCGVAFADGKPDLLRSLQSRFGSVATREEEDPAGCVSALQAYFSGRLDAIEGLAVDLGGTPFQQRVWAALREIPAGRTVSYGEIAAAVGSPTAVRAVGAANGRNPVPIVVPCHRVIRADGHLCGYGGGIERKRWLLEHEAALVPSLF